LEKGRKTIDRRREEEFWRQQGGQKKEEGRCTLTKYASQDQSKRSMRKENESCYPAITGFVPPRRSDNRKEKREDLRDEKSKILGQGK